MEIGIYKITSFIHDKNSIEKSSSDFLKQIEDKLQIKFNDVGDNFEKNKLNIFFIRTGGTENQFKSIYKNTLGPYYLLASNTNNSLAASMEILSFLKEQNEEAEIIHGSISYIATRIEQIYNGINSPKPYINFGVIGEPSDWLIASNVDYKLVKNKLKINLIDIKMEEFIENINKKFIPASSIVNELVMNNNYENLNKSLEIYGALKILINKYNLNGLTIRCFDLLSTVKSTSCLALAILNSEGYVCSCEGDIPSLISMYIIKEATNLPSFQANPSSINPITQEVILAHCTLPLKMVKNYKLMTHFESGLGCAIKGELPLQQVTVFKASNNLNRFYLKKAKIIENLNEINLCRTQIKLKFDDVNYFLTNPIGNHHLIVLGEHIEEIQNYINKIK